MTRKNIYTYVKEENIIITFVATIYLKYVRELQSRKGLAASSELNRGGQANLPDAG